MISIYIKLGALACAFGIAFGQVLFKAGALSVDQTGSYFAAKSLALFVAAFGIYFGTSIAWAYILRIAPLGQIYPYMALAFVIVPIFSKLLFAEQFSWNYFVGVALIVVGVSLCSKV